MARQGLARLLTIAGLALALVAGGALLPESNASRAVEMTIDGPAAATITATTASATAPVLAAQHTPTNPPTGAPTAPAPSIATDTPAPDGQPILPQIDPAPALEVQIPGIGVNAAIVPVDSRPTGQRNAWGGEIYSAIDFPVDDKVRQWVRRGDPNSLSPDASADDPAAFDRTVLYGHASDIGNHLVFQDLSALRPDDVIFVTTAAGRFTYRVTEILTRDKTRLDNLAALYDYPTGGAKELALVACLPDTTSNVVVLATLTNARPAPGR